MGCQAGAALVHSDIGSADPERDQRLSAWLAGVLPPLVCARGVVASDRELASEHRCCPAAAGRARRLFLLPPRRVTEAARRLQRGLSNNSVIFPATEFTRKQGNRRLLIQCRDRRRQPAAFT